MGHLRDSWWVIAALCVLGVAGMTGAHVVWAILGGALIGGDSLLDLLRISAEYPDVPLSWRKLVMYAQAVVFGIAAGVGVWAIGAVSRMSIGP